MFKTELKITPANAHEVAGQRRRIFGARLLSYQMKRTPQDYVYELIVGKLNPLVIPRIFRKGCNSPSLINTKRSKEIPEFSTKGSKEITEISTKRP